MQSGEFYDDLNVPKTEKNEAVLSEWFSYSYAYVFYFCIYFYVLHTHTHKYRLRLFDARCDEAE